MPCIFKHKKMTFRLYQYNIAEPITPEKACLMGQFAQKKLESARGREKGLPKKVDETFPTDREDCRVIPMGIGEGQRYFLIGQDEISYTPCA